MIKIWVIYQAPSDFPDSRFVMREHHIRGGGKDKREVTPTEHFHMADTLAELRRKVPAGKQKVLRHENDEPQIVEWWF